MLFLTIPTAHSHPELLESIVNESGIARERIVLIATRANLALPEGCIVVEDLESPNIQRWWNRGIEEAEKRGATAVAVLNDDLKINPNTLTILHRELLRTGAAIATPTRPDWNAGYYTSGNIYPYTPIIWGCLWVLNLDTDLRPDPQYVWWYGDSDLDIRARTKYRGIVSADVYYEHFYPGEGTSSSDSLVQQTHIDGQTFEENYRSFLKISRETPPRRLFLQSQEFAGEPLLDPKYRSNFKTYIEKFADPSRDRVVLVEPNLIFHDALRELWANWTNVLISGEYLENFSTPKDSSVIPMYRSADGLHQSAFALDIQRLDPRGEIETASTRIMKLSTLIDSVTPGATLDTLAFDSRIYSLREVTQTPAPAKELIAVLGSFPEASLNAEAQALRLISTGRPWGPAHSTAAFAYKQTHPVRTLRTAVGHALSTVHDTRLRLAASKRWGNFVSTRITQKFDRSDLLDKNHGLHLDPICRDNVEALLHSVAGATNAPTDDDLRWNLPIDSAAEVSERINACHARHGVWPISFAISEFLPINPDPVHRVSPILPGYPYSYDSEMEYLKSYADSYLALTHRKAGWDCFRHLEIMASGSVPLMPDAAEIPPFAMVHYPKSSFRGIAEKAAASGGLPSQQLRRNLRDFFLTHLTTRAMARYVMNTAGIVDDSSVLFLDQHLPSNPEYLSTLLAIGFKENIGAHCTIHHRAEYLYQGSSVHTHDFYGRGFGYVKKVDPSLKSQWELGDSSTNVDLSGHDFVVVGSVTRNPELTEFVLGHIPSNRVVLIHGEDQPPPVHEVNFLRESGAHVFIRSIY